MATLDWSSDLCRSSCNEAVAMHRLLKDPVVRGQAMSACAVVVSVLEASGESCVAEALMWAIECAMLARQSAYETGIALISGQKCGARQVAKMGNLSTMMAVCSRGERARDVSSMSSARLLVEWVVRQKCRKRGSRLRIVCCR